MIDIKSLLRTCCTALQATSSSAYLDSEILIAYALKVPRTYLFSHPEHILTAKQLTTVEQLINQRQTGKPIAYITQQQEFWSLPFFVNEAVLIPRPDSELLVATSIDLLKQFTTASILELGTGSGAIALSLAYEFPNWQICALDNSQGALKVAKYNAQQLKIANVEFCYSNWFQDLKPQQFTAIISNPPYIAPSSPDLEENVRKFEPINALISSDDGLQSLTHIIKNAAKFLIASGYLVLEHSFDQGNMVRKLLGNVGFNDVTTCQDLQNQDRVTYGRKPS